MYEFIYEIASFLIKAVILVGSLLIVISAIAGLALKQKLSEKNFKLTNLSEKMKTTVSTLKKEILGCKEGKKLSKQEKKDKKKDKAPEAKVFVLDFNGDVKASAAEALKKTITLSLIHI